MIVGATGPVRSGKTTALCDRLGAVRLGLHIETRVVLVVRDTLLGRVLALAGVSYVVRHRADGPGELL